MRTSPALAVFLLLWIAQSRPLLAQETRLGGESVNGYNPTPSPDGNYTAFVRSDWEDDAGSGVGRSGLVAEVMVVDSQGAPHGKQPISTGFLGNWSLDSRAVVCFRDGESRLVSIDGRVLKRARHGAFCDERAAYVSGLDALVWIHSTERKILTSLDSVVENPLGANLLVPSGHSEFLLGADSTGQVTSLGVLTLRTNVWHQLPDRVVLAPQEAPGEWDWLRPSWHPWARDCAELAYITTENDVVLASADKLTRRVVAHPLERAGLATPSPDAKRVAFVTFEARKRRDGTGRIWWTNSVVWVAETSSSRGPRRVTGPSDKAIHTLAWRDGKTLLFDRLQESPRSAPTMWTVTVPDVD